MFKLFLTQSRLGIGGVTTTNAVRRFLIIGCMITVMPSYHYLAMRWPSLALKSRVVESSLSVQQQQQRRRHLQEACSASGDTWSDPGRTFIVSHDLQLVFCVIGKAACTSWLRTLLQLTGNPAAQHVAASDRASVHGMFHNYLEPRSFQNATQLTRSPFKDYYKLMFVREPLERLVSAYRDKMFRAVEYIPMRQYIIKRFRRHPSPRSLQTGDDVQFEEFVRYVLYEAHPGYQHIDHHWRPQYNLCQPCHINYDFIGHYETLRQDAEHVLRQISRLSNNTAHVQFPATDLDHRNRNSHELMRKFYGEISTYHIPRLLELYKKDYNIFGYEFPDVFRQKFNI